MNFFSNNPLATVPVGSFIGTIQAVILVNFEKELFPLKNT